MSNTQPSIDTISQINSNKKRSSISKYIHEMNVQKDKINYFHHRFCYWLRYFSISWFDSKYENTMDDYQNKKESPVGFFELVNV
jgi:hypothetical protein